MRENGSREETNPEGDYLWNVSNHLRGLAQTQPDSLAVVVARGGEYLSLSALELDRWCDRACRALSRLGSFSGVRVALMVPPSLEFFALTFALFRLEAVPVLVDPGLGLGNVRQALAEAQPRVFIGIPRAQVARRLLGWGRGSIDRMVTVSGPGWLFGGKSLRVLLGQVTENEQLPLPASRFDQEAAVLFTSGSTGPPKGALYTHGMFAAQVEVLRREYRIEPGERDLATFPLFALFGPALGMAAVVPEMDTGRPASADPRKLIEAAQRFECTNLFASPALIDKLGRHCESSGDSMPSLRRAISAGAPMTPSVLRRFVHSALKGGVELFTPYGMTECLPATSVGSRELLSDGIDATERGAGVCVGRPVGRVDVRVIEIEDGAIRELAVARELEVGQIGEIIVSGPVVSPSYVARPEADRLHKIEDGERFWHRTGDVGYFDRQGRLWICGRKSHRVVAASGTLFTVPCEAVFNRHPAVRRSALVGVPDSHAEGARWEIPVLCVELESGSSRAGLEGELRQLALSSEKTREIERFLIHPKFPVDVRHNAKIFREKLRKWAIERTARLP